MKPIYLLLLIGLVACGSANGDKAEAPNSMDSSVGYAMSEESSLKESPPTNTDIAGQVSPNLPDVVVPKLIRNADLRFQVENLEKSSEIIDQMVKLHGAYISTANMSSTNSEA